MYFLDGLQYNKLHGKPSTRSTMSIKSSLCFQGNTEKKKNLRKFSEILRFLKEGYL